MAFLAPANQTLFLKRLCNMCDSGHVLAMIFPGATGAGTFTWNKLINGASVCIHKAAGRRIRALIQRVWNAVTICIRVTSQGETCIKWPLSSDIGSNT